MNVAIIGTGIAGLTVAHHLHADHDLTLFEANEYIGGHTHTVDVELNGHTYAVDTGFIVFNQRTYPHFLALLDALGVPSQPTRMSFSVTCARTGLEYSSTSAHALFAQRRNLLSPAFLRMLYDIMRFNREAPALLAHPDDTTTLGAYVHSQRYSRAFIEHYLVPMGAAIWSAPPEAMHAFPASLFVRFFQNHGLLDWRDRPVWRVIQGGSRQYVSRLVAPFADRIRLRTPVTAVRRRPKQVEIHTAAAQPQHFDAVFLACHSDQALQLLADPSRAERAILGAMPYQKNAAVLHTDVSLLPRRRLAWAAWNYRIPRSPLDQVAITYNMNILQGLCAPQQFCVTLNDTDTLDSARIIRRLTYHHPVYTVAGMAARQRYADINGVNRTFFCGAYWYNGFHEDGVRSGLEAVRRFQYWSADAQLHLSRLCATSPSRAHIP